jgi:hypothetical protein
MRHGWLGLLALTVMSCGTPRRDDALRTVEIYDLLTALPRANVHMENANYLARGDLAVGDEVRPALFLHPTASVEFPRVHLSNAAVMTFKIGIVSEAWDKTGDGVEFSVIVMRSNDAETKVYSRYVDPKHNAADRRWIDGRVSLAAFHDQDVQIKLATGPGPANDFSYDWALWSAPQIILNDSPQPRTR